jgi:hypothetical protein
MRPSPELARRRVEPVLPRAVQLLPDVLDVPGAGDQPVVLGAFAPGRRVAALRAGAPRVPSRDPFRNRGTESRGESGMKRMSGSTRRQCDRALGAPGAAALPAAGVEAQRA